MPETQAYSVDWTVSIQPEGDVSEDVAKLVVQREDGVNSATVVLDTSKKPHALEEQRDISISIDDGNESIQFDGFTDAVKDDPNNPAVTIDARTPTGLLKDTTSVGRISEDNLFRVIEAIISNSPGQVRQISFDAASLEERYGSFKGTTNFGSISIAHVGIFDVNRDDFTQEETADPGKEAELRIGSYENTTATEYELTINGLDADGNSVSATVDLPPGSSVQDAFGESTLRLNLTGGNEKFAEVTGITTDIPDLSGGYQQRVLMSADIFNYVKTDWHFEAKNERSVYEAIQRVVSYISGLDEARDWEFYVDDAADELQVQPKEDADPDIHVFREGDNVLKPVANRDLDGVRNFVKVDGASTVSCWLWAYNGEMQYSVDDPFNTGEYPDGGLVFESSPAGGQNDIDQQNLRAVSLESSTFTSIFQALEIGKKALRQFIRTPVSGKAPVEGVRNVQIGDMAEIYYPSRGIPQKVEDNRYPVEQVEYTVTPEEAKTVIDFGTQDPNMADIIQSGGEMLRTDISDDVKDHTSSGEFSQGFPQVGTLIEENDDGTWVVEGRDGVTYESVEVI